MGWEFSTKMLPSHVFTVADLKLRLKPGLFEINNDIRKEFLLYPAIIISLINRAPCFPTHVSGSPFM